MLKRFGEIAIKCSEHNFSSAPKGRGGGFVVRVLGFYSDDPSSNPADYKPNF